MIDYIALISEDDGMTYHVMFPDFPGCVTKSSTIAGAKRMAREVLSHHIGVMQRCGMVIPGPSSCTEIMDNHSYHGRLAFEVSVSSFY